MRSPFVDVLPALTTPFDAGGEVDLEAMGEHASWLLENGCSGLIPLGSLGEGATLGWDEKCAIVARLVDSAGEAPVLPGVGATSTREAVRLAEALAGIGARGLMVLPPYAHRGAMREALAHVGAVIGATDLPCMLYNNPIAYGVDFDPCGVVRLLGDHPNLVAVKESSGDCRRVTAMRARCGERIDVLVGLDDMLCEGLAAGARGWVAGLVNAFPEESVRLYRLARSGETIQADALYRWFLPLLRLDTEPEFVQWIKLAQHRVGRGSERVRGPRLPVEGGRREVVLARIERALATRVEVL